MATYTKRAMVTLRAEWEPALDRLKKECFYNSTQAEMFRYLIALGLESVQNHGPIAPQSKEELAQ